jgi:hypothetical protein
MVYGSIYRIDKTRQDKTRQDIFYFLAYSSRIRFPASLLVSRRVPEAFFWGVNLTTAVYLILCWNFITIFLIYLPGAGRDKFHRFHPHCLIIILLYIAQSLHEIQSDTFLFESNLLNIFAIQHWIAGAQRTDKPDIFWTGWKTHPFLTKRLVQSQ